jgi:hypothetical protein
MSENEKNIAENANERAGLTVIGPEATDDQVQHAADMADGKDDGIAALPSTDLGNALAALKNGSIGKLDLFYCVVRDMFVKGDLHGTASEDLEAAEVLGTALIAAAKLVIALLPK